MNHILDNMIWHAITTGNKDIAILDDVAGCYQPDIAPFAAIKEWTDENLERLYAFLPPGRKVALSYFDKPELEHTKWQTIREMDCCQMVYEHPVSSFITPQSELIVPLTREHVPQMLELTALTRPGPFLENTILFGNYVGIFSEGRLAAMAGERMHPVPYLEVSAVCTHPAHRGKGYAKACMLQVMKLILDKAFIPFLHVLSANEGAIHLYETIGFRVRKKINIDMVKRL